MLVVFGGLPGVGKTTIARAVASRHRAAFLRIDVIEQAIRSAGIPAEGIGPAGYAVANALAEANLANGVAVVADGVNPVPESRAAWRAIARRAGLRLVEVEIVCSDPVAHRRRVEERRADVGGHILPTWQDVLARRYVPWPGPHLVIDTAGLSPEQAIARVERHIESGTGKFGAGQDDPPPGAGQGLPPAALAPDDGGGGDA